MALLTVAQAEQAVLGCARTYGIEDVPLHLAAGRVLAAAIVADRDLPPCNRVTMDGIAISYSAFAAGIRSFRIRATMAAGDAPVDITAADECIELMTGCALPATTDTVVRYEDVEITAGMATITTASVTPGANIHAQGIDKRAGDAVATPGALIDAAITSIAASVGMATVPVAALPRVVIISTGDELVDIHETPAPYQVRRSNSYAIQAVLRQYGITARLLHIADDAAATDAHLGQALTAYDAIILSGGVSMGKFDYVPAALERLGVKRLFHKVAQRPGKPFWFGEHTAGGTLVFAFPGNPVSAFLCTHRYFIPWLRASLDCRDAGPCYAVLGAGINFAPPLSYFLQVALTVSERGVLTAMPVAGNGSGDYANLMGTNAFMELPGDRAEFRAGDVFRVWPFKQIL